jgi:hypothetical protein
LRSRSSWLILRRALTLSLYYYWRIWLVGLLLAVFTAGLLGLFRPDWKLGSTDIAAVTAGGNWGHALVAGPIGVLVWLGSLVGAVSVFGRKGGAGRETRPRVMSSSGG